MITVFLVEDEMLVREALKTLLSKASNVQLIGEAGTEKDALLGIREKKPQVVLLDMHLPDGDGLHVAQELLHQYHNLKIIILTAAINDTFPKRLVEVGVHGYLTKGTSSDVLLQTIEAVVKG